MKRNERIKKNAERYVDRDSNRIFKSTVVTECRLKGDVDLEKLHRGFFIGNYAPR